MAALVGMALLSGIEGSERPRKQRKALEQSKSFGMKIRRADRKQQRRNRTAGRR